MHACTCAHVHVHICACVHMHLYVCVCVQHIRGQHRERGRESVIQLACRGQPSPQSVVGRGPVARPPQPAASALGGVATALQGSAVEKLNRCDLPPTAACSHVKTALDLCTPPPPLRGSLGITGRTLRNGISLWPCRQQFTCYT